MPRIPSLFEDEQPNLDDTRLRSKGRNPEYILERNTALADRYYYHNKINKISYSAALLELSKEFFISRDVVAQILRTMYDRLLELKQESPNINALKNRWPFYNWN